MTPTTPSKTWTRWVFAAHDAQRWEALVKRPHGIILVTGPTGSADQQLAGPAIEPGAGARDPPYRAEMSLVLFLAILLVACALGYVLIRLASAALQLPAHVRKFRMGTGCSTPSMRKRITPCSRRGSRWMSLARWSKAYCHSQSTT